MRHLPHTLTHMANNGALLLIVVPFAINVIIIALASLSIIECYLMENNSQSICKRTKANCF